MWVIVSILIIFVVLSMRHREKMSDNTASIQNEMQRNGYENAKEINHPYFGQPVNSLYIDHEAKKVGIACHMTASLESLEFSDIVEVEVVEDGSVILSGGVGRAVVGGILAGGVGAVVGAATRGSQERVYSHDIRIITRDTRKALYEINLLTLPCNKRSDTYRNAATFSKEALAALVSIIHKENAIKQNPVVQVDMAAPNIYEDLEKLASLRQKGIITEDEYSEKKKLLLDKIQ